MRVLVTGARGTLAPCVIRALWERHEVVLLSRRRRQVVLLEKHRKRRITPIPA